MGDILNTLKLSRRFDEVYSEIIEARPYNFNLLDQVGANENGHSKILGKVLNYKINTEFPHLKSLLKVLNITREIKSPIIRVEKERIDISILDVEYAIVIENKIHYAVDQVGQLSRYVEIIRSKGYVLSNIYVVYLTRFGYKVPDNTSLPQNLRNQLSDRYIESNFNEHILPWLINAVVPNCESKNEALIFGIKHYIDHLKGFLKSDNKFEAMEIKEFFNKELGLNNNDAHDIVIIQNQMDQLAKCASELDKLRIEIRNKLRMDMLSRLYDRLLLKDKNWKCVTQVNRITRMNEANHRLFGFKNDSYKDSESDIFFSVEIHQWRRFLCGIFGAGERAMNEFYEMFKEKGVKMISDGPNSWLYLDLEEYKFEGRCIGEFVYSDEFNNYYANNIDSIVDLFYDNVQIVFEAWKLICEEKR